MESELGPALKMLCWEGYDAASMRAPFISQSGHDLQVETLLSDELTARRLLAGETGNWDILNINNAYIRDCLYPQGCIQALDQSRFARYRQDIHPLYEDLLEWSYDQQGNLIGLGQRFGPFNLVVNTDAISRQTAQNEGFNLANEPGRAARFGILDYPDFNVFHFCIGAGLDPFGHHDAGALSRFEQTAIRWFQTARMVTTDHHSLNAALLAGDIDFYISGGVYTVSPARLAGHHNLAAVTPTRGPIDGKGGIVFTEITSILAQESPHPCAQAYLEYLLQPGTAIDIAFVGGTCNPVAQMGNPEVLAAFSSDQLKAIQWEQLEADIERCAHYRIPPQNERLLEILSAAKAAR